MQVLGELKQRGVQDILICCVDGLKGFPEAIEAIFPNTTCRRASCAMPTRPLCRLCFLNTVVVGGFGGLRSA